MEVELIPFNTKTASQQDWNRFHVFRKIRHFERSPDDPLMEDTKYQKIFSLPETRTKVFRYSVIEKGLPDTQIGQVYFSIYKDHAPALNYDVAMVDVSIINKYRNKGIGKFAHRKIVELARKYGKSTLLTTTSEEAGKLFIKKAGGNILSHKFTYRLNLNKIDWALVDRWAKEGKQNSPKTTVIWYNSIPDELIEDYRQIYAIALDESPHWGVLNAERRPLTPTALRKDEMKFIQQGGTWLIGILHEENGDFSGITEIKHLPSRDKIVVQFLTFVKNKYRGQTKGKWLKAMMLERIRKQFPQVSKIITGNVQKDSPMFHLNQTLGFKVDRESITASIPVETMEKYLK